MERERRVLEWVEREIPLLKDLDPVFLEWQHRMWKKYQIPHELSFLCGYGFEDCRAAQEWIAQYWPMTAASLADGSQSGEPGRRGTERAGTRITMATIKAARRQAFGAEVKGRKRRPLLRWEELADLVKLIEDARVLKECGRGDGNAETTAREAVLEAFGTEDDDAIGFLNPPKGMGITYGMIKLLATFPLSLTRSLIDGASGNEDYSEET